MTVLLNPHSALKAAYLTTAMLWREFSPSGRKLSRKRSDADRMLDALARTTPYRFEGTVLVDGMWDNPNFWLRYSLLRAAIGLAYGHEIGLLGAFRQRQSRSSFAQLGIDEVYSFPNLPTCGNAIECARELVAQSKAPEEMLAWTLPGGVHPAILYDGVLKRQRRATISMAHPNLKAHVAEAIEAIERSRRLLDRTKPDLVVLSHPFNFTWGSLAWLALSRGIPVILVFGLFGVLRFVRFTNPADIFCFYDRPSREEMDALPQAKASAMAAAGRKYLEGRMVGRADDLASVFAFQKSKQQVARAEICARFGWDPSTPIVAFYASNWFDWPHQLGMTQFRDFLDWTEASFGAARENARVNWLFKPHPAEDWFGGVSLADILAKFESPRHIGICEKQWNNTAVMRIADALVTYHGTAGVEFAALGKPVLVPDRGKYDDCGFVRVAQSRTDYLDLLSSEWWVGMDLQEAKRRAEIFAGWWFCAPDWQEAFVLPDDSRQDEIYDLIPGLLLHNRSAIDRELEELHVWWTSGHPFYHTSKMLRAERFNTAIG